MVFLFYILLSLINLSNEIRIYFRNIITSGEITNIKEIFINNNLY